MQDLKLTIEQVSTLSGVKKSTLRYWERSFPDHLKPTRTPTNRRQYSFSDLETVKRIAIGFRSNHLTAKGVRLMLKGE